LIEIFEFIKDDLDADLSNKQLAKVVGVSEDYVGEYLKYLPELIHRIIKKINEWKR